MLNVEMGSHTTTSSMMTLKKKTSSRVQSTDKKIQFETAKTLKHVLHWDELPMWMKVDPYIKQGYRKQLNSFSGCFWSLFYSHNEFVNIWSHLLPALTLSGFLLGVDPWVLHKGIEAPLMDNLIIQLYVMGTVGCLFLSVGTCLFSKSTLRSVFWELF